MPTMCFADESKLNQVIKNVSDHCPSVKIIVCALSKIMIISARVPGYNTCVIVSCVIDDGAMCDV